MKLTEEYKKALKNLFETCENLKKYIFSNTILEFKQLDDLEKAYEDANRAFEEFDKNLRFED